MNEPLTTRVTQLEAAYRQIADTRMHGVAVLHARVHVQAVDFTAVDATSALGVLVTPWFMNLIRLPLQRASDELAREVGRKTTHTLGALSVEFISAFEPDVGAFESCSLFSPLTMFQDHDAVIATAREVMRSLTHAPPVAPERVSRRSMFFGRGSQGVR